MSSNFIVPYRLITWLKTCMQFFFHLSTSCVEIKKRHSQNDVFRMEFKQLKFSTCLDSNNVIVTACSSCQIQDDDEREILVKQQCLTKHVTFISEQEVNDLEIRVHVEANAQYKCIVTFITDYGKDESVLIRIVKMYMLYWTKYILPYLYLIFFQVPLILCVYMIDNTILLTSSK